MPEIQSLLSGRPVLTLPETSSALDAAREMSRNRMIYDVATADVVVEAALVRVPDAGRGGLLDERRDRGATLRGRSGQRGACEDEGQAKGGCHGVHEQGSHDGVSLRVPPPVSVKRE